MARKCSLCGNYGHNSRTCSLGGQREAMMLCEAGNNNNGGGCGGGGASSSGLRLFGVQVHVGGGGGGATASSSMMKKSYSMDCLQLAAASAAVPGGCSLVSPSSSSSSSMLLSIDEGLERAATNGYLSDGPHGRAVQERKKGVPWSEEEHRQFLVGLENLGKGDWRGISRSYVTTRTPTQVASHAQKFFLRQNSMGKKKRRSSLFDMVPICEKGGVRVSDQPSSESTSTTSLSLSAPRDGSSDRLAPAFDLNSAEEDDSGRAAGFFSLASGAGTTTGPSFPHGHHCSPLELELGMSLSSPSVGT